MDRISLMERLSAPVDPARVAEGLAALKDRTAANNRPEVYRACFGLLDVTTLETRDSAESVRAFTAKAVSLPERFPDMPPVASVCVSPLFVEDAGLELGEADIAITSTGGGFPLGHTYTEVKMLECAMAMENGADEIDIVMNVGGFLEGDYGEVAAEIALIRKELGRDALLKVILETGEIGDLSLIRRAALLAMAAGADFVKTSTGKTPVSATPEAAWVMCEAIRDYTRETGRAVGFKAAGGIREAADAVCYYTIVESILGPEWLTPERFRLGASRLANSLLSAVRGETVRIF